MAIRVILISLKDRLESDLSGNWAKYQLKPYDYGTSGDSSGIRARATADSDNETRGAIEHTKEVNIARLFKVADADLFEAQILAAELYDQMCKIIDKWGLCQADVRSVDLTGGAHVVEQIPTARSSQSFNDIAQATATTATAGDVPVNQNGWYGLVEVNFNLVYID